MPDVNIILGYISVGLQSLILLLVLFRWNRVSQAQKWIAAMMLISVIIQAAGHIYGHKHGNNLPFFHLHIVLEFSLLWWIFRQKLTYYLNGLIMPMMLLLFILIMAFSLLLWQGLFEYPTILRSTEALLVTFFCLCYYLMELKRVEEASLLHKFMFWMSTGFLLFFVSNLLITVFGNWLIQDDFKPGWDAIWSVHNTLNVLLYFALTIAILLPDQEFSPISTSTN